MADIQAKIESVASKPEVKFESVLQEKLGSETVENTAPVEADPSDIMVSNNLMSQVLSNNSDYSSYLMSNIANNAPNNCAMCAAQASQGLQAGAYSTTGAMQNYSTAGTVQSSWDGTTLPEGFEKAAPYMEYVSEATQRYGMPQNLILGIMRAESDFNNECVSSSGAKGLMQLMPETAAEVGVTDEFDPRQNILGSVEYVTKLINKYDGDVRLALAAYNTGPGKIDRRGVSSSDSAEYLTVPQSIRDYADRVLRYAGYQV